MLPSKQSFQQAFLFLNFLRLRIFARGPLVTVPVAVVPMGVARGTGKGEFKALARFLAGERLPERLSRWN